MALVFPTEGIMRKLARKDMYHLPQSWELFDKILFLIDDVAGTRVKAARGETIDPDDWQNHFTALRISNSKMIPLFTTSSLLCAVRQ